MIRGTVVSGPTSREPPSYGSRHADPSLSSPLVGEGKRLAPEGKGSEGSWERSWAESFSATVPDPSVFIPTAQGIEDILRAFPQGPATARTAFFFRTTTSGGSSHAAATGSHFSPPPASASPSPSQPHLERSVAFVGHHNAGKSSLLQASFYSSGRSMFFASLPTVTPTVGLHTHVLAPEVGEQPDKEGAIQYPVVLRLLDGSGHEAYQPSNSRFLTEHSVFVLVWNISAVEVDYRIPCATAKEELRLQAYMSDILSRFPHATLVLVGTHLDTLRDQEKSRVEQMLTKMEMRMWEFMATVFKQESKPSSRSTDKSTSPPASPAGSGGGSPSIKLYSPMTSRFQGNFAVSCRSHQIVAAGRQRGIHPTNLTSVVHFLTQLAKKECMRDSRFYNGVLPSLHIQLNAYLKTVKNAFPDRVLLPMGELIRAARRIQHGGCGGAEEGSSSSGPMKAGEAEEVFAAIGFLHDRGSLFWFDRYTHRSVSQKSSETAETYSGCVMIRPTWLYRITNAFFSFAHVLSTPRHQRNSIEDIEFTITEAEMKDQLLLRKGYLSWPVARTLFRNPVVELFHRYTDAEVGLCISLLVALEFMYPVEVPTEDPNVLLVNPAFTVAQDGAAASMWSSSEGKSPESNPLAGPLNTPSTAWSSAVVRATVTSTSSNTAVTPPPLVQGMVSGKRASPPSSTASPRESVVFYFVPSFAPRDCPAVFHQIAPLVFHQGVRRRMSFNALPRSLWERLQCRLHRHLHLVSLHHPTPVSEPEAMEEDILFERRPKESDDEHNRWRDTMWLHSTVRVKEGEEEREAYPGLRGLLFRQGHYPCHVYLYTSDVHGAAEMTAAVQQAIHSLLQEYRGLTMHSFVGCPNTEHCESWILEQGPVIAGRTLAADSSSSPPTSSSPSTRVSSSPTRVLTGTSVGGPKKCSNCGAACPTLSSGSLARSSPSAPDKRNAKVFARHKAATKELLSGSLPPASCREVSGLLRLGLYDEATSPAGGDEAAGGRPASSMMECGKTLDRVVEMVLYQDWSYQMKLLH